MVIKTQNLDDYPEEYFDRLVRDLEALGYIAFTNGSSSDEIITICDANIRYLIDDTEKFNQMVANRTLIISPSSVASDSCKAYLN